MKRMVKSVSIVLLLCSAGVSAQIYKSVGPDGKTTYSDVPPSPAASAQTQQKTLPGNVVGTGDLPFSLAETVKASPVTLYTGPKCLPCDQGRKLLTARGIPFAEKTVSSNADIVALGGGQVELPQLAIGNTRLRGYAADTWQARLSTAGYPESSRLPDTYRNPAPRSLAPAEDTSPAAAAAAGTPTTPAADTPAASARPARPPARNTPKAAEPSIPGLRF